MNLNLPSSKLQASLATALETFRRVYLQQALTQTIEKLDLKKLNTELDEFAPAPDLLKLASRGLRGEFHFPVPLVLETNPKLLGYYRLLLGFSQKELFNKHRFGRFKSMEEAGIISSQVAEEIPHLCRAFAVRASELLEEIGVERFSLDFLDDLTLLTVGPQLRGGNNTKIGQLANEAVFQLIQSIVGHAVQKQTKTSLVLNNSSKRAVEIAFSSDPDISIVEHTSRTSKRKIIAIEIIGGGDKSNIWNRLGEAEKSHQTAKQSGFVEFWTIYNVRGIDLGNARKKSPTTNEFYSLDDLLLENGEAFEDFRDRLVSLVGIVTARPKKQE